MIMMHYGQDIEALLFCGSMPMSHHTVTSLLGHRFLHNHHYTLGRLTPTLSVYFLSTRGVTMSGQAFAQLMALSRSNTDKKQDAVQQALQERKRREEAKRKENEENERKEKQRAEAERKRYFEKQKQEAEMEKRRAEQEKVAEAARQRRKDEQRDSLLYGPKKAKSLHSTSTAPSSSYPKSSSGVREDVSAKRAPTEKSGALALTREELRERKQQAEQRKMLGFSAPKRPSGTSGGTHRAGRRLPGGAMDMMSTPQSSDSSKEYRSVRERLAAQPNMLTKLNVVKRDVRSIDEIMRDRENAKAAKTLNGDDAKGFDGWFDTKKKPQAPAPKSTSEWSTPVSGEYDTASGIDTGVYAFSLIRTCGASCQAETLYETTSPCSCAQEVYACAL
jgi:hypothetical protein